LKSTYTIACRGSWLSLAQAHLFIKKVNAVFPHIKLHIKVVETAGDREQSMPLHLVEGKDFFTKEIQQTLNHNEADFAIHSMKDVSSLDFFNEGHYAVFDRELLQDVAIFNSSVITKLQKGEAVIIGTSSPRRSNMATAFLQKGLPQFNKVTTNVEAVSIRGNVDTRLQKLHDGQYDGIILAAAGLNRLLQYEPAKHKVADLLKDKKVMLLPLFECPPAAGQGAVVAETQKDNAAAITILKAIADTKLTEAIRKERVYAGRYGYGCSQPFGVFHLDTAAVSFTYASGSSDNAGNFTEWNFDAVLSLKDKILFSSADYMKSFFEYNYLNDVEVAENTVAVFISSYKVVHSDALKKQIENKKVWASGTKTWYDLAKKGIWVEGCADGLGFNFLLPVFKSPLVDIEISDIQILTNKNSAQHWIDDGFNALYTYELKGSLSAEVKDKIANADIIFWTSYQQYELCKGFLKDKVQHVCPSGKTATLLQAEGLAPVIFPTIKSFIDWKKKLTAS
jgi:hydroxymethylbilane synthase